MISVSKWVNNGFKGVVTIEGSSYAEVASVAAKNMAIAEASKQFGLCGISSQSGPYVVDHDNKEVTDGEALAALIKDGKGYKYHNDFDIMQSMAM